ncbi:hypothetical protein [Dysgonomonas sp. BGC7]|uniref:hypothetical protein n=1 Tax=Dysgonomonas sp. BGC7 TaxID=1658008 RepID=UPI000683270C|nr:hypothetical protein [Dysgonomonas sp. BGC7]MBD8387188.1 hypothetical protein [Dysgonomonas sp. BGC7]
MAGVSRFYKKNIAEGKGILFFSILFAIIFRLLYFTNTEFSIKTPEYTGYLWSSISWIFSNQLFSFISSCVATAGIAIYAAHINTKHVLIRRKTLLLPSILVLAFSCHPSFMLMSAEYISTFIFLFVVSILFSSYNSPVKQTQSSKATFFLVLGSLFCPFLLVYTPLLWLCLGIMRCFNLKAFLASLSSIVVVYFPLFSIFLIKNDISGFTFPLIKFANIFLQNTIPLLEFSLMQWCIFIFCTILLNAAFIDNYLNRHKDKIKVRAYLNLLSLLAICAIFFYILAETGTTLNLYIAFVTGAMLLSHFYALAEQRATAVFFYISLILFSGICILPFLQV